MKIRAWTKYVYECQIPVWIVSNEYRDDHPLMTPEIESHFPLPCDGGGVPGHWCERCHWGKYDEIDGGLGEYDGW